MTARQKNWIDVAMEIMYGNTQCSICRENILIEMGRRRMVTKGYSNGMFMGFK